LLQAEKEYSIPFSNAVDYRMEKQGKESEKINMMMVATKENIPFTDEVTYQNVLKWVYSIPNDKRCAFLRHDTYQVIHVFILTSLNLLYR